MSGEERKLPPELPPELESTGWMQGSWIRFKYPDFFPTLDQSSLGFSSLSSRSFSLGLKVWCVGGAVLEACRFWSSRTRGHFPEQVWGRRGRGWSSLRPGVQHQPRPPRCPPVTISPHPAQPLCPPSGPFSIRGQREGTGYRVTLSAQCAGRGMVLGRGGLG